MRARAIVLIAVVVLMGGALFYSQRRTQPLKVSGFIEADEIRVGSRVGGRVAKVPAVEGQAVKVGDVLVELEPFDLAERRAEAAAQVQAKKADLERLTAGYRVEEIAQAQARRDQASANLEKLKTGPRPQEIAAAEARVRQAEAQRELTATTLNRVKASFERNAASADEMNNAVESNKSAIAALDVRKQELEELKAGTRVEDIAQAEAQAREAEAALAQASAGYRKEEIAEAQAAVAAAEASLSALDRQLAELTVKAPVNGVIEAVDLQPGDLVAANAPVLSIMDTSHLWVRAYVPENRMNLQPGQQVSVSVDSIPQRRFKARIGFIARQAEFTPNNVQTPEERSKQVFRIKVDLDEGLDVLRAGMSADVWLAGEQPR